jgi:regulator of protease activity HflC (stomatin/prohibitin superfamily)
MMELLIGVAVAAGATILTSLRVLREYERGVVFRLGRLTGAKGPGLIFLLPFGVERMVKVPLRIVAMDIPPQDVITRDNVSIKVNAVVYFRVADPVNATIVIQDYLFATSQLAQTTIRSVIGQAELDQLLAEREHFNDIVRGIIDEGTDPWGIDVVAVEIKDIDLPQEMRRAMAKQAEAERERRSKVIAAHGEFQASQTLADAAEIMQRQPAALQLRYLQTLAEIATENNSTTLFPIPIDLFRPFIDRAMTPPSAVPESAARSSELAGGERPTSLPAPNAPERVGEPDLSEKLAAPAETRSDTEPPRRKR